MTQFHIHLFDGRVVSVWDDGPDLAVDTATLEHDVSRDMIENVVQGETIKV